MKLKTKILKIFLASFVLISFLNLNSFAFDGEILIPNALKKGDKVCILELSVIESPDTMVINSRLLEIKKKLNERGFEVEILVDPLLTSKLGVGDGTEKIRADIFNNAVNNPEIKAIFAFWGGFGAIQTLNRIDYKSFRKNKKIFVGFSDETAVMIPIFEKSGLITFHGPMVGASLNWQETICFDILFDMLMIPKSQIEILNIDDNSKFIVFKEGNCEGRIVGGNMWEIQHLMGTPYSIDLTDKILFFEEDNENEPYRLHTALWQMKLNKNFDKLRGIVIGFLHSDIEKNKILINVVLDVLKDVNIPVIYNFHAGHTKNPITVPIGAKAKIENGKVFITQAIVQ